MNFGDILDKWENKTPGNRVYNKGAEALEEKNPLGERRSRLLRKKPDAHIDLHGLNGDEAWSALEIFFERSRRDGLEKLLIIHGKGNHKSPSRSRADYRSAGGGDSRSSERLSERSSERSSESVLREISRHFIESCSFAGESGYCSAREGGTGSTWVILKGGET